MSDLVIGPEIEGGLCDQCVNNGDRRKKSVRRIVDSDNIYLCKGCVWLKDNELE